MKKSKRFFILLAAVILQLSVLAGIIITNKIQTQQTLSNGEKVKFIINYMQYNGKNINIDLKTNIETVDYYSYDTEYHIPFRHADGLSHIIVSSEKPEDDYYVKTEHNHNHNGFPDFLAVETENYKEMPRYDFYNINYHKPDDDELEAVLFDEGYVEAYIYKGNIEIEGVYIDGMTIDDYLKKLNEEPTKIVIPTEPFSKAS